MSSNLRGAPTNDYHLAIPKQGLDKLILIYWTIMTRIPILLSELSHFFYPVQIFVMIPGLFLSPGGYFIFISDDSDTFCDKGDKKSLTFYSFIPQKLRGR